MRLPEGGKVGRYEILAKVGQGANGAVYRAQDPTIRRIVALKVIPAETMAPEGGGTTTGGRSTASFFEREAQAAGSLLHPHIVTLYDAGRDGDWYYLAMEFIEGGTFASEIAAGVSIDRAVAVGSAVADALDYAHEHGVVHRDIKPANLMILPDQKVKVTDFGIARLTSAASTMTSDMMVGTPHYMSPEQVQGGSIDGRSDLFSLGVVLYEALTRTKPFHAESLATILSRIMSAKVTPPHEVTPRVPQRLSAIVMRAMARDRDARYARGRDLAIDLRAFLGEQSGDQEAATVMTTRPAPARAPRFKAAVAGALLLVAIGGGTFLLRGWKASTAEPGIGFLVVTSEMPGVDVYLDGKLVGPTPATIEASEGSHELEFQKEGYYPAPITVEVLADQKVEVPSPPMLARSGR